jgi:serine phosphatase RsbU (regulator of sigma subunit)
VLNTLLLISIVYAVWRYTGEQSRRRSALEQEYRSAQELQQLLVPNTLPAVPGYAVTSAYLPAQEVGGDFFQVIPLPQESALLIVGDVSGKGLKAAMTVSLIVGALRSLVETTEDPAEILAGLNRRVYGRLRGGFVTCLVLRLGAKGECVMASAGHLAPFLNGDEIPVPPALPLGLIAEAEFEKATASVGIGDRLTLYTDGLLEARNAAGELFGFRRVAELVAGTPDAREAAESGIRFGQDDDITVLTATRLAPRVEATTVVTSSVELRFV